MSKALTPLETETYVVTDKYFGQPYIDSDAWLEKPHPHRKVHGGFKNTDTRFTFCFPPSEDYQGRMFHPLEGAHAGHENAFSSEGRELLGGISMIARLGGYMVESNSGHIGDDIDPKGGEDPTLYGHRASVETARFSKHVAAQIYGKAPDYSYVWGGSGGGRRSPLCLEYGAGVYQGALPFMGGGVIAKHGTTERIRSDAPNQFSCMFNVQRIMGSKIAGIIDAMQPGGSGNPFEDLTIHQREQLDALYRLGYPRGDEFMIAVPMGQMWLWTSTADMLQQSDADYFKSFWTKPGYIGHDEPQHIEKDVINVTLPVTRILTARDFMQNPEFSGPEYVQLRNIAVLMGSMSGRLDLPVVAEIAGVGPGYRLGAGLRIMTGKAAGRQLYCMNAAVDSFLCDGHGEANIQRFTDVAVGDQVLVDNRAFMAYCYYYRHHILSTSTYDFLRLDGRPRYPQHQMPEQSPLMGVAYSGQYEGKLLWVHHTHDSSLWPSQGEVYKNAVLQAQGPEGAAENFQLRWAENAEHLDPGYLPSDPRRATNTWLIDYMPLIEQSLVDLCDWVEKGIRPAGDNYQMIDGKVTLPSTAAERGGIQPVVTVKANGSIRADVKAGQKVALEVRAEVAPQAGRIIAVEWDFDGSGTFPFKHDIDGGKASLTLTIDHVYDKPGTYFASVRVASHRQGDVKAQFRRVLNLASARVVVS